MSFLLCCCKNKQDQPDVDVHDNSCFLTCRVKSTCCNKNNDIKNDRSDNLYQKRKRKFSSCRLSKNNNPLDILTIDV